MALAKTDLMVIGVGRASAISALHADGLGCAGRNDGADDRADPEQREEEREVVEPGDRDQDD